MSAREVIGVSLERSCQYNHIVRHLQANHVNHLQRTGELRVIALAQGRAYEGESSWTPSLTNSVEVRSGVHEDSPRARSPTSLSETKRCGVRKPCDARITHTATVVGSLAWFEIVGIQGKRTTENRGPALLGSRSGNSLPTTYVRFMDGTTPETLEGSRSRIYFMVTRTRLP
jgi:hypothetical protein